MRDLQKYAKECIIDMNKLGITVPYIKEFKVNTRAKQRFGQCRKEPDGFSININVNLLNEEVPLSSLKETLYHEIIHTLPNCFNHGYNFKKYADIVNKAYKVNVSRCSTNEEKYGYDYARKIKKAEEAEKQIKIYELYCPNCDDTVAKKYGHRAPKWYVHTERYSCGRCKCKALIKSAYVSNTYSF